MTTSEVFLDYLGLTPAGAPWAYRCGICYCTSCAAHPREFTATSPLARAPNPAWLYELVDHERFESLTRSEGFVGAAKYGVFFCHEIQPNPIHAVARALIAADPALRARLEACSDWKEVAGCS